MPTQRYKRVLDEIRDPTSSVTGMFRRRRALTPRRAGRLRRTWPQRFVLVINLAVVVSLIAAAAAMDYGDTKVNQIQRQPETLTQTLATVPSARDNGGVAPALNFLITGSDDRSCIAPDSPYIGAFGAVGGERTDTIMVLRVDPNAEQAAIISFPRDLWLPIADTGRNERINTAVAGGIERLVKTITSSFGIEINHTLSLSFCGFKELVDALGGIRVPFEQPTRDLNTGLFVTRAECHAFTGKYGGEEALAYVRSRHYQYFDGRRWQEDGSSDFGRIKRQQDFVRRLVRKAIARGARNPAVLNQLLNVGLDFVIVDETLSVGDLAAVGNRLRNVDPDKMQTYTLDSVGTTRGNAAVLVPRDSEYNRAVLSIFRGEAAIPGSAIAPPTEEPAPTTAPTATSAPTDPAATTVPGPTTTTLPVAEVPELGDARRGIVPPDDPDCRF